jgi:hypothetical protein
MKYWKQILALGVWLLCSTCSGILNKDPIGILDTGSFFQTAQDVEQAVNAAYNSLLFNNDNNNFYWGLGVIASDEAIVGGDGSRPGLTELDFLTHTPRTQELNDLWKLNYKGITQCNTVLDKVPDVVMDEALKSRYLAEAKFLRAYYYFLLTQIYGDVPLILQVLPPAEVKVPRTAVAIIRAQILKDCEDAALVLPVAYPVTSVGRATKGAALGLAAKTKIYQKDWAGALDYIQKIKAIGIYKLMADYRDNFRKNTQNNSESVWEIQHTNLQLGVGNSLNQWWASKKYGGGYGFAEVSLDLVNAFEAGDPRLKFTVAKNRDDYFGVTYFASFSSTQYSPLKYLQSDKEATQKADGDINYTAIRYAEVLLWEAEALTELNRFTEAEVTLEVVRARARSQATTPATTLPAITTQDKAILQEAVRHERQVELAYEMHRFFDLVRWGLAKTYLSAFIVGKHELFPLPQTEMDLNSKLIQNPGY